MNRQIVPICLFFISNLRLEVLAMTKKVAIIMGSDSDLSVMMEAADKLKQFDIPYEVHIISAHRTPAAAERFASAAVDNGFGVIIAAA